MEATEVVWSVVNQGDRCFIATDGPARIGIASVAPTEFGQRMADHIVSLHNQSVQGGRKQNPKVQLGDFAEYAPWTPGSDTSKAAADRINPYRPPIRRKVFDRLYQAWVDGKHGLSDYDLMDLIPHDVESTVEARRGELVTAGLVRDSGYRVTGKNGNPVALWTVVTPEHWTRYGWSRQPPTPQSPTSQPYQPTLV